MFENDVAMYIELYCRRYTTIEVLFEEIINDVNHGFWRACHDVAKEKLKNTRWRDASTKVDYIGLEATRYMSIQLVVWLAKAREGKGALAKHLNDMTDTIDWLFERWISTYKNTFDKRYKFYIPPFMLVSYNDDIIGEDYV